MYESPWSCSSAVREEECLGGCLLHNHGVRCEKCLDGGWWGGCWNARTVSLNVGITVKKCNWLHSNGRVLMSALVRMSWGVGGLAEREKALRNSLNIGFSE